jgi:glycosyltransferase involved in cell wall biosynthesis
MSAPANPVALLYDDDGYVEALGRPPLLGHGLQTMPQQGGGPIGRQVAGKEFLDALLTFGTWDTLVALVRNQHSLDTLVRYFQGHPSQRSGRSRNPARGLLVVPEREFLRAFFPTPPAGVLYMPCPPDLRYAWARQHRGPGAFALCGVTHTLCSQRALEWLGELVTAPFEPYDALVCTSRAVRDMVRAVTGAYADYLRERVGGAPRVRLRLELIPLGVDTEKFRPPTGEERADCRELLHVAPDEVAVLFVGRLSHHTKAHPFPMFHAAAEAARANGRKVHLLVCGWAPNAAVMEAFRAGATAFARGVRVSFVDGTQPRTRAAVWRAADVFTSLSDNIQETFGLVLVEAMASGLPVVASDWDGYRDLVVDGETGLLVPTLMLPGATADVVTGMQMDVIDYDHFLAECSQAVAVDCGRAAEALTRLVADEALRRRLGAAGRQRAVARFAWAEIIRAYEALWRDQEQERLHYLQQSGARPAAAGSARYPSPEHAFAGYPTHWLGDGDRLCAAAAAAERLEMLLKMPLVNHVAHTRVTDPALLRAVLAVADGRPLRELEEVLIQAGAERGTGRATLMWLLKYDLLRVMAPPPAPAPPARP